MPFWVFVLTNPFSLILYFLISEFVKLVVPPMKQQSTRNISFKGRLLVLFCFVLISTAVHNRILFTDDYRKSLVDASPLAYLSREHVERVEDVLYELEGSDSIVRFEITETSERNPNFKVFDMSWYKPELYGGVAISARLYVYEQRAIDSMQYEKTSRFWDSAHSTVITNDNGTEAILFDSYMSRSHGLPVSDRYVRSHLRLGNAIIVLTEDCAQHRLHKNVSSEFIKVLCDMLAR